MAIKQTLLLLATALLVHSLWDLFRVLSMIYTNEPSRLQRINEFGSQEIKFADQEGVRSCEDGQVVESLGIAIVACDPGREKWNTVMGIFHPDPIENANVYVYDYSSPEQTFRRLIIQELSPEYPLHTLGLAYDEATSRLFVVNAGGRDADNGPAIEVFHLDLQALTARHLRTIKDNKSYGHLKSPNSIVLLSSHELLVTNDHYFPVRRSRVLSLLETYLSLPIGSVVHIDFAAEDGEPMPPLFTTLVHFPYANGLELLNETTLAVASTNRGAVQLFDVSRLERSETSTSRVARVSPPRLTPKYRFSVPFMPDNLASSSNGKLYISGHAHLPTLAKFARTRHLCNSLTADDKLKAETCSIGNAPSVAYEWSEAGGLKALYTDTEYPSSATVSYDAKRKVGILAGLYARGLLVWRD